MILNTFISCKAIFNGFVFVYFEKLRSVDFLIFYHRYLMYAQIDDDVTDTNGEKTVD